jgi:putative component of membrane protein insertase Oxa1/YidC/SpoIIIJ protein YidD
MATCIERFGAARGVGLGLRRLSRCHPFHAGGIDLPPPSAAQRPSQAVVADEAPISLPVQRSSEQSP